jgi:hypothetical protein
MDELLQEYQKTLERLYLANSQNVLVEAEEFGRVELERLERLGRDQLVALRKHSIKSIVPTFHCRGFGPAVWPKHAGLPSAQDCEKQDYQPKSPTRSCLQKVVIGEKRLRKRVQGLTSPPLVHAGPTVEEKDLNEYFSHYRAITVYAPVRHMVMVSMKTRFGGDSSDPKAWVGQAEAYWWLDEIFCEVKDAYQSLHDEQNSEWATLMNQNRSLRPRMWFDYASLMWV